MRYKRLKEDLSDYEVIFENFKENSFLQQGFLVIFAIRSYLFYVIVSYLFAYPLIQTILINLIGFAVILYLCLVRPCKSTRELIEYIIQEIILEIISICAFIFSVLDSHGTEAESTRETLGEIIVGINTYFSIVGSSYFLLLLLFQTTKKMINHFKQRRLAQSLIFKQSHRDQDISDLRPVDLQDNFEASRDNPKIFPRNSSLKQEDKTRFQTFNDYLPKTKLKQVLRFVPVDDESSSPKSPNPVTAVQTEQISAKYKTVKPTTEKKRSAQKTLKLKYFVTNKYAMQVIQDTLDRKPDLVDSHATEQSSFPRNLYELSKYHEKRDEEGRPEQVVKMNYSVSGKNMKVNKDKSRHLVNTGINSDIQTKKESSNIKMKK